jgi:hypothetical protein
MADVPATGISVARGQIRTSQHNAQLDQFEKPLQQVATTAIAVAGLLWPATPIMRMA